ncbi:MAG: hypothetical protein Q4G71_03710 [Pseudomonadota bacterium]|nr:hypothetical protein [Pseudomonadota bacterium]
MRLPSLPGLRSRLLPGLRPLAFASALALSACGGSGSDDGHTADRIDSAGLLVLSETGSPSLRVLDLDTSTIAQTLTLAAAPSALATSPGGRYALAMQRAQDQVQVIDGGLWQEDHGDHLHDYRAAPQLLAARIAGPRPTHYEIGGAHGAIFMDGEAATQRPASVTRITDASLARTGGESQFDVGPAVHGTAEPRGDHMLVSARSADAPGTLPDVIDLYHKGAQGWQLVSRLDGQCPHMHGSYSSGAYSVFGCADGVLVVSQSGTTFSTRKIANPPDMPEGRRIGTLIGHAKLTRFVGLASPGHVFDIDPANATITSIAWAEGRTRRAHAFDRTGRYFVLLDDTGTTHWLDASAQWRVARQLPVLAQMPTSAPFPQLVASRSRNEMFLTDASAREVAVLDSDAQAVKRRIRLDFAPAALAWTGIAAP